MTSEYTMESAANDARAALAVLSAAWQVKQGRMDEQTAGAVVAGLATDLYPDSEPTAAMASMLWSVSALSLTVIADIVEPSGVDVETLLRKCGESFGSV